MTDSEVSLRLALFYIRNNLTYNDVHIFIDDSKLADRNNITNIHNVMVNNDCISNNDKLDNCKLPLASGGVYSIREYLPKILIKPKRIVGNVHIYKANGTHLCVECRGINENVNDNVYYIMKDAIGRLITGCTTSNNTIPTVAVPYSDFSYKVALSWSRKPYIKLAGIKFILVKDDGSVKLL